MKSIIITAPNSGSGKTTFTLGLLRVLQNRFRDVCAFKLGPDYIDKAFLEAASGAQAYNIDFHLQKLQGAQYVLNQGKARYGVLEAAMGYFDGIYNTYDNSAYHVSRHFNLNATLIYSPKGEMFSVIPKLLGMANFKDSKLKAVIFNNVSEHYFTLLRDAVEKYTELQVLGYLPKTEQLKLPSRHLGLVQNFEIDTLQEKINIAAKLIESYVDLQALLSLFKEPVCYPGSDIHNFSPDNISQPVVAIAKDEAFSFYYHENLDLLKLNANVIEFSPLRDEKIPDCDMLYLGGGYPEIHLNALSQNHSMLKSIKDFGERGGKIWAECGGFMYLLEKVDGKKMVGLFNGTSTLTNRLQNFGYNEITLNQDCLIGKKGDRLTSHEFHKSVVETTLPPIFEIKKTGGSRLWTGGYQYKNVCGGFPHLSFVGNMTVLKSLLGGHDHSS